MGGVEHGEMGRVANRNPAALVERAGDGRRCYRHPGVERHGIQRSHRVDHGSRPLQAGDPVCGMLKRNILVVRRVRRMVGGDSIDGSVAQASPQRIPVLSAAQRRHHLVRRVGCGNHAVVKSEMMGRHLGSHIQAAGLCCGDHLDATRCRQMLDVVPGPGQLGEPQVSCDDDLLCLSRYGRHPEQRRHRSFVYLARGGEAGIDCMLGDHTASGGQVVHRLSHEAGVGNRIPIVGEHPDPGLPQLVEVGELFAVASHRHRSCWPHIYEAGRASTVDDEPCQMAGVDGRIGVRHRNDRGVTAGGGCRRAGRDVFLPLLPRLAQVGVEIDEPGAHPGPVTLDDGVRHQIASDLDDRSVGDADVGFDHAVLGEDAASCEHEIIHRAHPQAGEIGPPFAPRLRWPPAAG